MTDLYNKEENFSLLLAWFILLSMNKALQSIKISHFILPIQLTHGDHCDTILICDTHRVIYELIVN